MKNQNPDPKLPYKLSGKLITALLPLYELHLCFSEVQYAHHSQKVEKVGHP